MRGLFLILTCACIALLVAAPAQALCRHHGQPGCCAAVEMAPTLAPCAPACRAESSAIPRVYGPAACAPACCESAAKGSGRHGLLASLGRLLLHHRHHPKC
jgi:hypothetical protein